MKFCPNCGQGNADESAFCAQCGAGLAPSAEGAATPPSPGAPPPSPASPGAPTPPPPVPGQAPLQAGPQPPPGAPPGYYPPPVPVAPPTDGMATASLIMGIAGFVFCGLLGILAIIFGYIGRRNIAESGGRLGGDSYCTIGIILGFIQVGLIVLGGLIWLIIIIIAASSNAAGAVIPLLLALL